MTKKRSTPASQVLKVPDTDPKFLGMSNVQDTVKTPTVLNTVTGVPDTSAWPKSRYASWKLSDTLTVRRGGLPRWFTAFIFGLLARQAYKDATDNKDLISKFLPDVIHNIYRASTSDRILYQSFETGECIVLAVPGTQDIGQLIEMASRTTVNIPGINGHWYFYGGFTNYITEIVASVDANFGTRLQKFEKPVYVCGHSRGGMLANWVAYAMNEKYNTEPDKQGPINAVFSYGACAGWRDENDAKDYVNHHNHFRFIVNGDPVPALIQAVLAPTGALDVLRGTLSRISLHYSTFATSIDTGLTGLAAVAQAAANYLSSELGLTQTARDAVAAHKVQNYTDKLFDKVLDTLQDTPFNYFGSARLYKSALDTQGV